MTSKDPYTRLGDSNTECKGVLVAPCSESSAHHRLDVTDPNSKEKEKAKAKDESKKKDGDSLSIESPPVSASVPRSVCVCAVRSKKQRIFLYFIGSVVVSLLAFFLAVIIELALIRPDVSISPTNVNLSKDVGLGASAKFSNPPHFSTITISSGQCTIYYQSNGIKQMEMDNPNPNPNGKYVATVTVQPGQLQQQFEIQAYVSSIDTQQLSILITDLLQAQKSSSHSTSSPFSASTSPSPSSSSSPSNSPSPSPSSTSTSTSNSQSSVTAQCSASVSVKDAVFGISYTRSFSTSTAVSLDSLTAGSSAEHGGFAGMDWLHINLDGGNMVVFANEFQYLVSLQNGESSHPTFGCYGIHTNPFSVSVDWSSVQSVGKELYNSWLYSTEWRREDCEDVCRGRKLNFLQDSSSSSSSSAGSLSVCSASDTFLNNLIGDHFLQIHLNTSAVETMHVRVEDSIHQFGHIDHSPMVSKYSAIHAQLNSLSSGKVLMAPPELLQAFGFDSSINVQYSADSLSSTFAKLSASAFLSIEDPSSFNLNGIANFNFIMDFRDSSFSLFNMSADFDSVYNSDSTLWQYGGTVAAAFILDQSQQAVTASGELAFDDNGQTFSLPTSYGFHAFGQYASASQSGGGMKRQIDVNGDVSWSGTMQSTFIGKFFLDETNQWATVSFAEAPPGAIGSPRTAYATVSPFSYSWKFQSSPILDELSANLNGQLTWNYSPLSIHSIILAFNLAQQNTNQLNLRCGFSLNERAGNSGQPCRLCVQNSVHGSVPASSSAFQQGVVAQVQLNGEVTVNSNLVSGWVGNGSVDGFNQLVNLEFAEGGINDYPISPFSTPRTKYQLTPNVAYSFQTNNGITQLTVNGSGKLIYSYTHDSVQQVQLAVLYTSGMYPSFQLDGIVQERQTSDSPSNPRVYFEERVLYTTGPKGYSPSVYSGSESGKIVFNYNFITQHIGAFALDTTTQLFSFSFNEGGANDYPAVSTASPRSAYFLTSPLSYNWQYVSSPLSLTLKLDGSGQLIFSRKVQSVEELSFTLRVFETGPALVSALLSTQVNERSGNDSPSVCRLCIGLNSNANIPTSSSTFSSGIAKLAASGKFIVNYNFLSAFVLDSSVNGQQKLITLTFSEGGQYDYPNVPTADARSAYAFTPDVKYSYSNDAQSGNTLITIDGSGKLIYNYAIQSIQNLQFSTDFSFENTPFFNVEFTVNERTPNDPLAAPRILLHPKFTYAQANQPQTLYAIAAAATITFNYNFITQFSSSFRLNTDEQTILFNFFEGGANDYPAVPSASPRSAYMTTTPLLYGWTSTSSPLEFDAALSGAGQLIYSHSVQSIHSLNLRVHLDVIQSLAHFSMNTNVQDRAGNDPPTTQRVSFAQSAVAAIPTTTDAFNSGQASVSCVGSVTMNYNVLSSFSFTGVADGTVQTAVISFAEDNSSASPPTQNPRTAFNVNGKFTYSTSPLIISSNGNGQLTFNRALQNQFQYTLLLDNAAQKFIITVSGASPNTTPNEQTIHVYGTFSDALSASFLMHTTHSGALSATAQAKLLWDCSGNAMVWSSDVDGFGECVPKYQWQNMESNPWLLCHVDTHTTAQMLNACNRDAAPRTMG